MRAFFLETEAGTGQRFCVYHEPLGNAARSALLYIHPFAEEMNKSRRVAALQARAMAASGHAVLQLDLRGCGDSSDDFGDASWEDWLADVELGLRWLLKQNSNSPVWLWGLRTGCLLAAAVAKRHPDLVRGLLYWQPQLQGKQTLQHFLRMRLASELDGASGSGVMKQMRESLSQGQPVEIAGYVLHPALARGLEDARIEAPAPGQDLLWLELSNDAELLPASQAWLQRHGLEGETAPGPAFWQSTELEEAPALIEATLSRLEAALAEQPTRQVLN